MSKRNKHKNLAQVQYLQQYYERSNGNWPKDQLQNISIELGIRRQAVYKYLWDMKNFERKLIKSEQEVKQQKVVQRTPSYNIKYDDIGVRGLMRLPTNLNQASRFTVDPKVSSWATDILRDHGWKIVSQKNFECDSQCQIDQLRSMGSQVHKQEVKNIPEVELVEYELSPVIRVKQFVPIEQELQEKYPFLHQEQESVHEQLKTPKKKPVIKKKQPISQSKDKTIKRNSPLKKRASRRIASRFRKTRYFEDEVYDSES